MVRIALCDDNSVQLDILDDLVMAFADESGYELEVSNFVSGEKLLIAEDEGYRADIYILDMIMPGIKGIELGKELRRRGNTGKIIYLTATAEYAVDSYLVGAFFYILKPVSRQKISEVLDNAITALHKDKIAGKVGRPDDRRIELKVRNGRKSVMLNDILYVDIQNRALAYHMVDGSVEQSAMIRAPFLEAAADVLVAEYMFAATPHLIVNLKRIERADRNCVTFTGRTVLYPTKGACSAILDVIQ